MMGLAISAPSDLTEMGTGPGLGVWLSVSLEDRCDSDKLANITDPTDDDHIGDEDG